MTSIDQFKNLNQNEDNDIVSYNELLSGLQNGLLDDPQELVSLPAEIEQVGDVATSFFEALVQLLDQYAVPEQRKLLDEKSIAFAQTFSSIVTRGDSDLPLLDYEQQLYNQFNTFRNRFESFAQQNANKQYHDELLAATVLPPEKNLEIMGIPLDTVPNWSFILKNFPDPDSWTSKLRVEDISQLFPTIVIKPEFLPYIVRNLSVFFAHYLYFFPQYKNYKGEGMTHHTLKDCVLHVERTQKIGQYLQDLKKRYKAIAAGRGKFSSNSIARDSLEIYLGSQGLNDQQFTQLITQRAPQSPLVTIAKQYESTTFGSSLIQSYLIGKLGPYKKAITGSDAFWIEESELSNSTDGKALLSLLQNTQFGKDFLKHNSETKKRMEALRQLNLNNVPLDAIRAFFEKISTWDQQVQAYKAHGDAVLPERNRQAASSFGPAGEPGEGAFRAGMYQQARNSAYADYYNESERLLYYMNTQYVTMLLSASPAPECVSKRQVILNPLTGTKLDFSQGNNPDNIVRDGFGEQFSDGVKKTVDAWREGKRSEARQQLGSLIGGSALFAVSLVVTKNPRIASASFTIGSRAGAATGGFLGALAEGKAFDEALTIAGSATGFFDQQGNALAADKIIADLAGDIVVHRATLGLSRSFSIVGNGGNIFTKGMKFGMQELVYESLLLDPAFNIARTGITTFVGISDAPVVGSTALNAPPDQRDKLPGAVTDDTRYQAWRVGDAFQAARESAQLNFSPENLGQIVSSTIVYGGMMEGMTQLPVLIKHVAGKTSEGLDNLSHLVAEQIQGLQNFLQAQKIKLSKLADGSIALLHNNALLTAGSELYALVTAKLQGLQPMLAEHRDRITDWENALRQSLIDNPLLQQVLAIAASFKLFDAEVPPVEHVSRLLGKLRSDLERARSIGDVNKISLIQTSINQLLLVGQYIGYHYEQKHADPDSLGLPPSASRYSPKEYYSARHTTVQKLTTTLASVKNVVFCGSSALFMGTEHRVIPEDVEPSVPADDFPNALAALAGDRDLTTFDITDVNGKVLRTITTPPQPGELDLIVAELAHNPGYQHLKITGRYQVGPVPYSFEIFFVDQGTSLAGEALGAATYDIDMGGNKPVRFLEKGAQADYYSINLVNELFATQSLVLESGATRASKFTKAGSRLLKIGMLRPDLTIDGLLTYLDTIVSDKNKLPPEQRNDYINETLAAYPNVREGLASDIAGFHLKQQQIAADGFGDFISQHSDQLATLGSVSPAEILVLQTADMSMIQRIHHDLLDNPSDIDLIEAKYRNMLDRIAMYQYLAAGGNSLSHLAIFSTANNMLIYLLTPLATSINRIRGQQSLDHDASLPPGQSLDASPTTTVISSPLVAGDSDD